ncbi:MAG: peptide chain release factor 1 [Phycisphaerae bacterium]|nr:peptide chain release factor 1 [Phycisphaerae bacterium]
MLEISPNLIAKLEAAAERYDQLGNQMNDPEVASNRDRIVTISREYARVGRIVEPYRRYSAMVEKIKQTRSILDDPQSESDMKELVQAEIVELTDHADNLIDEILQLLVMSDQVDVNSVILEIRAGTGGDEAALFAGDLLGMYTHYAERMGWKVEVLSVNPTDLGGFREVIVNVKGNGVWDRLCYEGGGHRVQRVPKTEAQGRIHTSAATVAVLPEPENIEVDIDWEKDVLEHVSRAGGPGGQNVNKVASAIKLEHVPTGVTVSMRDEKSQHKNRAKARRILASRVYEKFRSEQAADQAAARKSMIGSGDRSQRIRTYNFPQNRCTDHRLKSEGQEGGNFNLQTIISGDLDELISALAAQEKARRLAEL